MMICLGKFDPIELKISLDNKFIIPYNILKKQWILRFLTIVDVQVPRTIIPVTGFHLILQERSGKDPKIPQEDVGNHWNRKQYSGRKTVGFFPADSYKFPMLSDRNRSEFIGKIPKISDRNTASEKKPWNYTETAVSRPDYSTWVL